MIGTILPSIPSKPSIIQGIVEEEKRIASQTAPPRPKTKAVRPVQLASLQEKQTNLVDESRPVIDTSNKRSIIKGMLKNGEIEQDTKTRNTMIAANQLIKKGYTEAAQQILGGSITPGQQEKIQAKQEGEELARAIAENIKNLQNEADQLGKLSKKPSAWDNIHLDHHKPEPPDPIPMYFDEQNDAMAVGMPPLEPWDENQDMLEPYHEDDDEKFFVHSGGSLTNGKSRNRTYSQLGHVELDKQALENGILAVRYAHNKHKIAGVQNFRIKPHFQNVLLALVSGHKPSTAGLSDNEMKVLNKIVKTSQTKLRGQKRLQLTAAEIGGGNSNRQLAKSFHQQLQAAVKQGVISKAQANAMLHSASL